MHVVRLLKVLCDDIPGAAGDRSYLVLGPLLSSLYTGVASEERDKRLIEWILREGKFGGRNLAEIKGPQSLGRQLSIHLKSCNDEYVYDGRGQNVSKRIRVVLYVSPFCIGQKLMGFLTLVR